MDNPIFITLAILIGMLGLTIPVYLSLFITGIIGLVFFAQTSMPFEIQSMLMVQSFYKSLDNFSLIVVLFFVLCGNIMTTGTIVDKLIKVAKAFVGFMPGGLGMAGILACALFGAISGSTVATVVAIGGFMIPTLVNEGYDEKYAIGVMTTAPILGIIIPPSISMILYSMVTNDSLAALFMTGYVPGILLVAAMCGYTYYAFRKAGVKTQARISFREMLVTVKEGFWALMLPVIIFVGIYSGVFTANEAAVVACVYAFSVEFFIHKSMKLAQAKQIVVSSAVTSGALLVIVSGATVFGKYLTVEHLPEILTEMVTRSIQSKWMFLLVVNLFLLVVGMFMDIISATLILTPIFLPMLYKFDINTLHFGLLMTVNLGIGYVTPPVGVSLYITGAMVKKDVIYVTKACMPFILLQLGVLGILTYFPDLVLIFPRLFFPESVH